MIRPRRTSGLKAPYVRGACGLCRQRRVRCTGEKPICQTCQISGRASDCTWGPEPVKHTASKEYVKSLRGKIKERDNCISLLITKLDQNGLGEDYRHLCPDPSSQEDEAPEFDFNFSDSEEDLVERLRAFQIQGQGLQWYGNVSTFQCAPTGNHPSRFPGIVEDASRCHVLMVDGVDESRYNPDFDWSRHLPTEVYLDRREHDKLLDLLFKFFTSWCLRIVPALFLRDMYRALHLPPSHTPLKTTHYSPMLHNALVALAMAFSDDPQIRDLKSRRLFLDQAKSYIDTECQSPNISVVHALSTIGSFHSSMGEQSLGYLYFGMSGRISQALGLGIDCSPWVQAKFITHDDMLDRNWAYWTTFSQDVCWSLYVGREICMASPSDQAMIHTPFPFIDSEFDQIPWHHSPSGILPQPSYLSITFAATCELLRIGRRIMEVVNVLNNLGARHEVSYEIIVKLDNQLNAWKEGIPPEVEITLSNCHTATPHRIMLELAFWWLFVVLHRPFYRRAQPVSTSDREPDHVKICDRAARNIMDLVSTWKSLYTLRYVPITFIQIVFSAGTVFVLSAVHAGARACPAVSTLSHSLNQAELCIQYLLETGRSFQCANHIAGILRNLLSGEFKTRSLDKKAVTQGVLLGSRPTLDDGASSSHPQNHPNSILSSSSSDRTSDSQPGRKVSWDLNKLIQTHRRVPTSSDPRNIQYPMHDNSSLLGSSTTFGMGLENLSPRHIDRQLAVFTDEQPREEISLTDEELAMLMEALNKQMN